MSTAGDDKIDIPLGMDTGASVRARLSAAD